MVKWINAKKWRPKRNCDCLIRCQPKGMLWYEVVEYDVGRKQFINSKEEAVDKRIVTHWAIIDEPKSCRNHPDKEPIVQQFHMYLISPSKVNENLNWLLKEKKLDDTLTVVDLKRVLQNSYKDYDVVL